MKNKTEDRRSFEFFVDEDTTKVYYLGMPTSEQIRKADWHYSRMYSKALIEGVATESEMIDMLKARGIIGDAYDKQKLELQISLIEKLTLMEASEVDLEKAKYAMEARIARDKLFQWNQRATGPLSNTCEQMANDAKTEYLTSAILQEEDGSLVWKDYDAFVLEANQRLAIKARYEVMLWLEGLEQDFLDNSPEDVVMRSLAEKEEAEKVKLLVEAEDTAPDTKKTKATKNTKKKPAKAG